MKKHTYTRQHAGHIFTLTVEQSDAIKFSPGEQVRFAHHMELGMNKLLQRYIHHVLDWAERALVLRKLTERDAEILGVSKEWLEAQKTSRASQEKVS